MTKGIGLLLLGLALTGAGPAAAEQMLPWSTVTDLEGYVTQAYAVSGCSDAGPMVIYVIKHESDTYRLLVVSPDVPWVIIGPIGSQGEAPIWYGTFGDADRLVIERELVGTPNTDVCPFLVRRKV